MGKTILIVEDRLDTKNMLAFALKKLGHVIFDADDGEKAFEIIKTKKIDIILLDILLPKLSGKLVLKNVRANKELDKIKIIMITAKKITDAEINEYKKIGANGFMLKPFKSEELRAELDKVIADKK